MPPDRTRTENPPQWPLPARAAENALGRAVEARVHAERAVELDPNWHVTHSVLAFAKVQSGDPLGALQSTSLALRLNPRLPAGDLMATAMVNYRVGRTDAAMEFFERIRVGNSDLILPRLKLAAMYESQGRDDEAQTIVQEILRIDPELTADLLMNSGISAIVFDARERAEVRDQLRRAGLP